MSDNELISALRQYRHNNKDGFVFGYDIDSTNEIVSRLKKEILALSNLITECTDCGELDGLMLNSYIEYFMRDKA